jgi:hypothetical protein
MRERIFGFIIFTVAVFALFASLKVLNWVPGILQEGLPSAYSSIEEVKSKLRIRDVYVPSYYPQGLRWPPSRITAQSKPYVMVLLAFTRQADNNVSLVISQTALPHPVPKAVIEMNHMDERVHYPLKGRDALLEVGLCRNDERCSRLSWNESPYRIDVIMLSPPAELVKIAESMVSEPSPAR